MSNEMRLDSMAQTFTSICGNWDRAFWDNYKSKYYGQSSGPHPNCALLVGSSQDKKFYSYINNDCINGHPTDFISYAAPVLNYINNNFQRAADSFLEFFPMLNFNNNSIFLAGFSGNMSVVLKLNVEVSFRCCESLTSKVLKYNVHNNTFTGTLEKEYNGIFNNVSIDLDHLDKTCPSFGLKFHTLGLDYTIACKPLITAGIINIFEASGTLSKSVFKEIGEHKFEINISSRYEAVIEVHQNMPSAPLLRIPGLAAAQNPNFIHARPATVDHLGMESNIFSSQQLKASPLEISHTNKHTAHNHIASFPWWDKFKAMAQMGGICIVSSLIINNNDKAGVLNTRVNDSFEETTLSTIISSTGFAVMVYLGRGLLLTGL